MRTGDAPDPKLAAEGDGRDAEELSPVLLRCSMVALRGDSVLLVSHQGSSDGGETWVLPGGNPRHGEGTAVAATREVAEETGLEVDAERVLFVLETTSWDRDHHLVEVVFTAVERAGQQKEPSPTEPGITARFVPLDELNGLSLRPPIAGYIRGYAANRGALSDPRWSTAAYLGNVWRSEQTQ